MQKVTAAVVVYNGSALVPSLAASLEDLSGVSCVIYDSCSSDDSCAAIRSMIPGACLLQGPNRGFGYGNNRCLEKIRTEYTLFLNSDASISWDSLSRLVSFLDEHDEYAAVQPLIRLSDWNLVTASRGVYLTEYAEAWDSGFLHIEPFLPPSSVDVPAVTAAVSLWRTDVLKQLGGFDEGFFMYFEDADLSLRAGASGWKMAVVRSAVAQHVTGASSTRAQAGLWELASSIRMFRRYFGRGRLNSFWWKREARICVSLLARGRSPLDRIRTVAGALKESVLPVELPSGMMSELFGSPMDMPAPRQETGAPGHLRSAGRAAPWAGYKTGGGGIRLELHAELHAVTGAVLDSDGGILERFSLPPGSRTVYELTVPTGAVYIKCDSPSDELKAVFNET